MRFQKTFSNLLISYLITMVFTISIGVFTYYGTLKVIEGDAAEADLSMLKQGSELIDGRLDEVENLVNQLSFHPMISSMINMTEKEVEDDRYKAIETWKYIQTYQFTSDFIYNFYITFANSHVIMSPKDISYRMPMYYEGFLQYKGMSYEEWNSEFMGNVHNGDYLPSHPVSINGKVDSYVTYIQTVPLGFKSNLKGAVFVLIPDSEIHRLLNRLDLQGGWLVITDSAGETITSTSNGKQKIDLTSFKLTGTNGLIHQKLGGEDMLISYYVSPNNKWKYVSAIPYRVVMKKADVIRKTNSTIIIVGLLVGILIAFFFAYRNSRPMRALLRKFGEKLSGTNVNAANEYHFLENSISNLIYDNETLQTEIEKQMPLLKAALLDRLFHGEFIDTGEAKSALSNVGIFMSENCLLVVVLRLEWLEDSQVQENNEASTLKRVIIRNLLQKEIGESGYLHDLQHDKIAMLLRSPQNPKEQCMEFAVGMVEILNEVLNKQPGFQAVFGLGRPYDRLQDVYRSFKEALKALDSVDISHGEYMLRYDQIPQDMTGYYYPLEIEQRIMNLVKSGNEAETRKLMASIHKEMTAARIPSTNTSNLLLFDLTATVYKLFQEVASNHDESFQEHRDLLGRLGAFSSFQEAFLHITETLVQLCRYNGNQKKSHNVELRNNIIEYIHNHYRDGNLGLLTVAECFGISEVYLSQFFKEQTGNNFSKYLEDVRMDHARDLLLQPDLTVDDVARQVGYVNTNTFYKAFKRIEGVSPGAFRSNFAKQL